jgi:long-subunit acyl-CoA synthetase (AMP-forming)
MVKAFLIGILLIGMVGCAEIKPMKLPEYHPPDLSTIQRPQIEPLEEGKDYTIDIDQGKVCYTLSGQNKLTAKVISENAARVMIETLKQMLNVQTELIRQKDQLIITIDLQRQYAEKGKTSAEIKMYASEIISLILAGLAIAAAL